MDVISLVPLTKGPQGRQYSCGMPGCYFVLVIAIPAGKIPEVMQRYLTLGGVWGQKFAITAVTICRKHCMPLGCVFLQASCLTLVISLEQQ